MKTEALAPEARARRRVLTGLGGLALVGGMASLPLRSVLAAGETASLLTARHLAAPALAAAPLATTPLTGSLADRRSRKISLHNAHTGERITETYWQGTYRPEVLAKIDRVLRDWRSGEVKKMDPALLDLLAAIARRLDSEATFEVISGYRSPKTNATLRLNSSGVAKNSLHTKGMAMDIRLPGYDLKGVRDIAWRLQGGGVGYYAKSGFVHLDTGKVRFWNWKPA